MRWEVALLGRTVKCCYCDECRVGGEQQRGPWSLALSLTSSISVLSCLAGKGLCPPSLGLRELGHITETQASEVLPGRFGALFWGHRTPEDRQPMWSMSTGVECPEVRVTLTREWGQWHPLLCLPPPHPQLHTPSPGLPAQVSTWPPCQQLTC